MSVNLDLVRRVEKNPKDKYLSGLTIYLKLLSNIINSPDEEKFRKIRKLNQRISAELLGLDGMEELILASGFEAAGDELVVRSTKADVMTKLKTYRDFFQRRFEVVSNSADVMASSSSSQDLKRPVPVPAASAGAIPKSTPSPIKISASKPFHERIRFPQVLGTTNSFLATLENLSDSVMQYEDEELQKSALQLVPTERFRLDATEKLRKFQKLILNGTIKDEIEPPLDDLILEELASWFKNEFFTWINSMPCKVCKNEGTEAMGTRIENGVRIEKFICKKNACNTITEFPRYNDIQKLLVSRSGRCGEYANCFTFLCRCLGYDARYIYSTSDHVWTEVYNHTKKRWIHIDPSENVIDAPLMYEAGWKRKLEYVLAFSRDDAQDVTWRYSNKHEEIKLRRRNCSEKELIEAVLKLRTKRQSGVSATRKKFLVMRTFAELSELLIIREPTENELKGRSSGSLTWRLERGETNKANFYVFNLTEDEKSAKRFELRYSCAKNIYQRLSKSKFVDSKNWESCIYQSENIFRKVEHDHKMAYLARTEDSNHGMMQFKFDFSNFTIKNIDVKFSTQTFQSGKLLLEFLNGFDQVVPKEKLVGMSKFSIRVRVSGGDGDCAWQHAQIFRESLNSEDFPFQVSAALN